MEWSHLCRVRLHHLFAQEACKCINNDEEKENKKHIIQTWALDQSDPCALHDKLVPAGRQATSQLQFLANGRQAPEASLMRLRQALAARRKKQKNTQMNYINLHTHSSWTKWVNQRTLVFIHNVRIFLVHVFQSIFMTVFVVQGENATSQAAVIPLLFSLHPWKWSYWYGDGGACHPLSGFVIWLSVQQKHITCFMFYQQPGQRLTNPR